MRRSGAILVLAHFAALAAWAEPSAQLQARMTGRFRVAERESELDQRLAAAIEHAVEPMNFIARPIARSRLRNTVYYCRQYQLALDAEKVRVACDDRPAIERRLDNSDGPAVGLDAEPLDVRVRTEGDDIVELAFRASDGTRTTTYTFGEQGALEVRVRIDSENLERPVAWKVLYRRAD